MLATGLSNLCLILEIHIVEEGNLSHRLFSGLHMQTMSCPHAHLYTSTHTVFKEFQYEQYKLDWFFFWSSFFFISLSFWFSLFPSQPTCLPLSFFFVFSPRQCFLCRSGWPQNLLFSPPQVLGLQAHNTIVSSRLVLLHFLSSPFSFPSLLPSPSLPLFSLSFSLFPYSFPLCTILLSYCKNIFSPWSHCILHSGLSCHLASFTLLYLIFPLSYSLLFPSFLLAPHLLFPLPFSSPLFPLSLNTFYVGYEV